MKKTRKLRKFIAMVIAIAMVIGLIPTQTGGLFVKDAYAATTDYFDGSGVSSGSTLTGWTWSSEPGTYKYNSSWSNAIEIYNATALTSNFYYTVSSLPAGTYTLQYSYYAGSSVTIQPYINGETAGTATSVSQGSVSEVTKTYEFTTTSAITDGQFGFQFVISAGGWVHINNIYLYGEGTSDSGSTDDSDTSDTVEVEWTSGNVPGTFESGTWSTSAPTSGNGFYGSNNTSSTVTVQSTYAHGGSKAALMKGSSSSTLKYGYGTAAKTFTGSSSTTVSCSSTSVSSSSWKEASFEFTPTATTYYLNFNVGNYYIYAVLRDLSTTTTYTVNFYYAGYKVTSNQKSSYYVLIDDVTVTYENQGSYTYAGTYTTPVVSAKTSASSVAYPSTVTINLENTETGATKTKAVNVTWTDTSSVKLSVAGTYTIYGTFVYDDVTYDCTGLVNVEEVTGGEGTSNFEGVTYNGVLVNGGDMIKGADVSSIISLENSGVKFYDTDGNEADLLQILADAGVNYIRVRIWNDPYRATATTTATKTPANSYGGGVCDLNYAVQLAERCAKVGIKYFVSFHYSDWWADPSRCIVPKAWSGYSTTQKATAIAEFTTSSLEAIAATGVDIGIVSVGNETTNYMCGVSGISSYATLMKSGCAAVREFDPNILIALHFTNPETWDYASSFASVLKSNSVDYDVFSTSYYPAWHGTLANLKTKLEAVSSGYGKATMITEFSYPYSLSDLDGNACTVSSLDSSVTSVFGSASESGQYTALKTMLDYVASIDSCIGMFYWEPAWISLYTSSSKNSTLWATYGSGWTTKYSSEYDSSNGSSTVGGSGCENQALFDMNGKPLKAISSEVFNVSWTDGYHPILDDVMAQVTTSTYSATSSGVTKECVKLRFVGNINGTSFSNAGFKIEVYDSSGEILKSISKKNTQSVYTEIKANGESVVPSKGYLFAYSYINVPADTTYYFKAIPYSESLVGTNNNANTYQKRYKIYKLANGKLSVVDEIGD